MKRLLSIITAIAIIASLGIVPAKAADNAALLADAENAVINYNRSVPLEVKGNKLVEQGTDNMVVLRGVNVPSLGWGMAEHIYESMTMVYDSWHANIIRLPIQPKYWFGRLTDAEKKPGVITSPEQYQKYVDDAVKAAQARGKYIILDCHTYVMPLEESLEMWQEVATKYANNSAVLFGLLNEPHDIKPAGADAGRSAWDVWRDGGQITINGNEVRGVGHQELLEAIRVTGANNICIAGGLNWAFDISGLADGYDGLENGYRLEDTPEGHGVMYDSHAYPVKGAKTSWNNTIGPVRRVAPVLIGEWGWDASDSAISGGDCTSDIWLDQLANWMDDEYDEYDGVPINWTAWNLHMSSSPRMLYSWDFKTTAFNGTYIKNRLKSHNAAPEKQSGVYETDFSTDDVFRSYTGQSGKASVTHSYRNENIVINHKTGEWSAKLDFPYNWDLNGIQTITMDISGDVNETISVGLYGADTEVWTTNTQLNGNVKTLTIRIDQLVKQGNPQTDGILDGAVSGIYFGSNASAEGNITVDNIKIVKLAESVYTPREYPHKDTGKEVCIDFDNIDFINPTPQKMTYTDAEIEDYKGNITKAKHVVYNGAQESGVRVEMRLGDAIPSKDTKYLSVDFKGSDVAQKISLNIGDYIVFSLTLEGDNKWHRYIYRLDDYIEYPEDIKYVKVIPESKVNSEFYIDNFSFTKEKPDREMPNAERTFVYDFATYNRNTAKYEASISTTGGSEGDTITASKADGGLDDETQALVIAYSRNGETPSKAAVKYNSSDFFKGNAGDDARTANRKTLKDDMVYMNNLFFYGKSTSGKNEKINIGILDAADGINTPTDTKEITLTTEWQQFKISFDAFTVLDGGNELDCARVRGFVFSSAEDSGTEGSFVIDNIIQTSLDNIDLNYLDELAKNQPTPTPVPTKNPEATPVPVVEADPPEAGENVTVVTTAEEFLALTKDDTTVQLGADIDLGTTAFKTKCPTYLDLNGHTLTSAAGTMMEVGHHFTITDTSEDKTGAVIHTGNAYALKFASGNCAISVDGAKINSTAQAIMLNGTGTVVTLKNDAVINGGTYAINAGANGTLNIESAIINSDESYKGYALAVSGATVTIEDGIFDYHGTVSSITVSSTSTVTINGGTFTNHNSGRGAINNVKGFAGALTINGGTFENTNAGGYSILDGDEATTTAPTINITDGIFKSPIRKNTNKNSKTIINITGGTFSFDPEEYVNLDYCIITPGEEDDTYIVIQLYEPDPDPEQTEEPTPEPTEEPTPEPTEEPTPKPDIPTQDLTPKPTAKPSQEPVETDEPTETYVYDFIYLDETTVIVEVDIPDITNEGDTMYVAMYSGDGRLCGLTATNNIESASFTIPDDAEEVKVLIWNKNMKPVWVRKQH